MVKAIIQAAIAILKAVLDFLVNKDARSKWLAKRKRYANRQSDRVASANKQRSKLRQRNSK